MVENHSDPYEYEVDLREYIQVIWREKWIILGIFLIAAGAAYGFSKTQPPQYETETTLLVTPRISEQLMQDEEGLATSTLSASVYRRSALAKDLLQNIIDELNLRNEEDKKITIGSIEGKMEVDISMDGEASGGSNLPIITMKVKGSDPDKIEQIANKWADLFIEKNTEILSSETARSYEFISERFQNLSEELEDLEEEKQQYREEHPIKALKSEVSTLSEQYESFLTRLRDKRSELAVQRTELNELEAQYEGYDPLMAIKSDEMRSQYASLYSELQDKRRQLSLTKTRIPRIEEALASEPQFVELERSVSNEAIWGFLEGGINEERLQNLPGLKVQDQSKNNIYYSLKSDLQDNRVKAGTLSRDIPQLEERINELKNTLEGDIERIKVTSEKRREYNYTVWERLNDLRIEVSSLEEEIAYLENKTEEFREEISEKQNRIDRAELRISQLDRQIDSTEESYNSLTEGLEEARIANQEKESSIRIMERAVTPESAVGTNTRQNVAVAGVLGLFIGVLVAFFKNYMQDYELEEAEEEEDPDQED